VLNTLGRRPNSPEPEVRPLRRLLRYTGPTLALGLIAAAAYVLWTMIVTIDPRDVEVALEAMSPWRVMAALAFTVIGHAALASYDLLAIRVVRTMQPISNRRATVAGLIANIFANTLGFPLLTGGSARYRIYSMVGAGLSVVGRIIALSWVTMWSGILLVMGLALSISPDAFPPLLWEHWMDRVLGALLLAMLAGFVVWVGSRRRAMRLGGWTIRLPGAGLAIGMIAAGAVDLLAAAGALWILLPPDVAPNLVLYMFTYTVGLVAGIAAATPGGLGVFEATIVTGLDVADRPDVAAALIMFRMIYFALPLLLGLGLMAFIEIRHRRLRALAHRTGLPISEVDEP
jgi:glycosyltransferase 2 family protein